MYTHHAHTYIQHAVTHTNTYNMQEYSDAANLSRDLSQTHKLRTRDSDEALALSLSLSRPQCLD